MQGHTDCKEKWYGAEYSRATLPQQLLARIGEYVSTDGAPQPPGGGTDGTPPLRGASDGSQQAAAAARAAEAPVADDGGMARTRSISHPGTFAGDPLCGDATDASARPPAGPLAASELLRPVPGELRLPEPNWALPSDLSLRDQGHGGADDAAPALLLDEPGLRAWHRRDVAFGIPKLHVKLHLITRAAYESPQAVLAARLLARTLEDVLMPSGEWEGGREAGRGGGT